MAIPNMCLELPEKVYVPACMVCQLRRNFNGLEQAAAVWFKAIFADLTELGISQHRAYPYLNSSAMIEVDDHASLVFLVLYVDD
ncbi:Reverse transcriptase, RNA-dependent DNA polymerase [Plasmopara halstedii]|uniref:Reverse transcriptase, RNA-dependent DNA polymerase n=1 Tax=Plasmopara halstedii TaxID=4781 RepID=A0A0P1AM99_PLAHL|nr:Reverse transcriptase, RNA-dependent DNA polymerase [Plasmopara halstedii]CEG41793.1 Reverse transcriptase, RNA-dependent DNA polymerase [Plasmopara halstedii]|eukprot:XP_024578162.1 Reverse transcriptase, RNA-dependent DNA polymerase [Plasmopara halstedii]